MSDSEMDTDENLETFYKRCEMSRGIFITLLGFP